MRKPFSLERVVESFANKGGTVEKEETILVPEMSTAAALASRPRPQRAAAPPVRGSANRSA